MNVDYALLTDLYQITMAQGYWDAEKAGEEACFTMYFRDYPFKGGYAVACGMAQLADLVETFRFSEEDIAYLASLDAPAGGPLFDPAFLEYLRDLRLSVDIDAVPEGTIVFPHEPLVRVTGPIMQCQLIETALLNMVNFQTLIATKAARVVQEAGGGVMEFGLRRAQGPDAGIYGARAAVIAGCIGTSNVLAGQMFDIPVKGTHAHSWIMSFPSELEAFRTYAELFPDNCLLLVDTYDTLNSGVKHAIQVFREMREKGIHSKLFGIRLDSGDLAYLSKKAYEMLEAAGFGDAIISASSDLDEYLIDSLKAQGATINSWGVGTNLITSKDCPAFGGVYKLAAIKDKDDEDFVPKIKLSENTEKITNPGNKTIYRIYDKATGKIRADLICMVNETFDESKDMIIFDPIETWKKTKIKGGTYTLRELLVPVFQKGLCVYTSPSVMEMQAICKKEQETLWPETRRLVNPQKVYVDLSDKLYKVKSQLLEEMSMKALDLQ